MLLLKLFVVVYSNKCKNSNKFLKLFLKMELLLISECPSIFIWLHSLPFHSCEHWKCWKSQMFISPSGRVVCLSLPVRLTCTNLNLHGILPLPTLFFIHWTKAGWRKPHCYICFTEHCNGPFVLTRGTN